MLVLNNRDSFTDYSLGPGLQGKAGQSDQQGSEDSFQFTSPSVFYFFSISFNRTGSMGKQQSIFIHY